MKILCLGDVVGKSGCEIVRELLPKLKKDKNIDLVIANGENSAEGNGILPQSADHLYASGVDVITGGNHTFRRREIYEQLDSDEYLLRPFNISQSAIGKGSCIYDMGRIKIGVINLLGCVYMEPTNSPFEAAIEAIDELKQKDASIIVVDFHAEATAEKKALAYYLSDKATILVGTHTHVQTNDDSIIGGKMGYITDLGMCGPADSVLGVEPEIAIEKLRTRMPKRFENAKGRAMLSGCIFEVDTALKTVISTEKVCIFKE